MVSENKTLSTGAPKEGFLVGFALGIVALVLSICCMSATAQLAYADTESAVGTGAYTTSENISVAAEDDSTTALATFTISATNDQKDAREILALVNQARTKAGVGALMWDYELEKAAIQRAAEIAILFSHDRPNGTQCFTAFPSGYYACGENIYASSGNANASSANTSWTNSPGHYANMINGDFTCMAAAKVQVGSFSFWVELFGDPNQGTTATTVLSGTHEYTIEVAPDNAKLSFGTTLKSNTAKGSSVQYTIQNQNTEWSYAKVNILPSSFNWTSSNSGVATIDANGRATAKGAGEVTITAKNKALESLAVSNKVTLTGNPSTVKEGWVHGSKGWWYRYNDGSYAKGFQTIKGATYYFDTNGWMKTGWQKIDNNWYYFKGSGAMASGWQKVGSKWYFMNAEGIMQTGKLIDKGNTYFLDGNGAMKTGWVQQGSDWYYANKSGVMVTGWQKVGSKWYYLNDAGVMASNGFLGIKGKYYHFAASGAMSTGWKQIDGGWYYFASSGAAKQNQWLKSGGKWYYFASDYRMCTGFVEVAGQTYHMSASGAMDTGWKQIGEDWRHFAKSGAMQANQWISGTYWVGADGVMATNAWVDGGKYWVDAEGKYDPNKKPEAAASVATYAAGSNVYHIYNCRSAQNINNPQTMTVAQAQAKGMTLCKNCESMSR